MSSAYFKPQTLIEKEIISLKYLNGLYILYLCFVASAPRYAVGNINGNLNNIEFEFARLVVNISQSGRGSQIHSTIYDAPRGVGEKITNN